MEPFASLLTLCATACWLRADDLDETPDVASEWRLLAAPFAASALLGWLAMQPTAAALTIWLLHLGCGYMLCLLRRVFGGRDLMRRPAWTMVGVCLAAASLVPHFSFAQTPDTIVVEPLRTQDAEPASTGSSDNGQAVELEELIVTGEKLGRSLAETTSSVGIVDREALRASTAATMKDVVSQFGNVVSAGGDRELAIRGVPQTGIGGEGDTISVYLDGVALPARAAAFAGPLSAWDLEQVEVLRGAQSTNQGRNSLAGSVVLRSREPTPYWDAQLRAGVMSRGGHDYAFAGGGPISDTLRLRVAAQDRYDNGDIVNLTRNEDDAGREVTRNVRAKLAWTPTWLAGYRAQYGYTQADNEFGDPLHDASGGERTETSNVRGNEDDSTTLHSLEQDYVFGDGWRVSSISGWSGIDNLYTVDYDRSAADGGYSDNTVDERSFSQELRLHLLRSRIKAVFGAYYADTDKATGSSGHDIAAAGGLVLLNGSIVSDSRLRTQALFAEADWDFADAWRLTAGLRYNRERSRRHDVSDLDLTLTGAVPGVPADIPLNVPLPDATGDLLAALLPDFVPPDYAASGRQDFSDLLPKLGLTWLISEHSLLALSYQEGYRSGGTSISFFGGAVSAFDPEYTRTVELAARTHRLDDRLMLNANVFYTRWRDQQVTIGETSGFETTTANAGRSHYYGLEAEALWKLQAPLEAFASLGWLRSEFDEFVNDGEDYAGNAFPSAPEHTASLGLTLSQWRRLSGRIALHYIGSLYGDADNDPRSRADRRALLHARLRYRLPAGFSLSVYGRNLTGDPNEQGTLVAGDRLATRYGEPRSVGATLEWQL